MEPGGLVDEDRFRDACSSPCLLGRSLGAEWLLTVKEDGREVFVGPRLVPFTPPKSLDQVPARGEMKFDAREKA